MKKIISYRKLLSLIGLLSLQQSLQAISTVMNHRLVTSSPLLYKQIDYSQQQMSFEIQPWISGMFDPKHTMGNLGIDGKSQMELSQAGYGDINPEWILLAIPSETPNYLSKITLTPELFMFGGLLHFYKQYEHIFFDLKTAVLNCKTVINIAEATANSGGMTDWSGTIIYDAYDAFTQTDWKYGNFGQANSLTALDNIQLTIGSSTDMQSFSSDSCKTFLAGFGILEIPTGSGTKGKNLFEAQVGTNHWALGFGSDLMILGDNEFSLVAGGNYRYMFSNWETRSFDLTENGQWSRYLGLDTIAGIDANEGNTIGLPGINLFTQDALIDGRSQITMYARLQKHFEHCLFELSYNYFYTQKELISEIDTIAPGYGIYDMGSRGGVTTASTATIAQAKPAQDILAPVTLVTSDLNLVSGAATAWMSNTIAARLQRIRERCNYGIGASVDLAASQQAMSTWSVWANFELLY
jgi:hypothetical protein